VTPGRAHGGLTSRLRVALASRPRRSSAALLAIALLGAGAARAEGITVTVGSVLATDGGQEFDSRLVAMKPQFDSLFRYSSYRLIKQERRALQWGQGASFDIPGGRYLVIAPKELRDSKVSMTVMLLEGGRPLIDTSVALRDHGVLLVGGPKEQQGVLIIAIGADTE
jgi:hypothetical protein